jgi:hypothetical protein
MKHICYKTEPAKRDYTILNVPVEFILYDQFERTKRCKPDVSEKKKT